MNSFSDMQEFLQHLVRKNFPDRIVENISVRNDIQGRYWLVSVTIEPSEHYILIIDSQKYKYWFYTTKEFANMLESVSNEDDLLRRITGNL